MRGSLGERRLGKVLVLTSFACLLIATPAIGAGSDGAAFDGFIEIGHGDGVAAIAGGHQRRFIHEVRQVCARGTRREAGRVPQVHILRQPHVANMNLQNSLAAHDVGAVHDTNSGMGSGGGNR